MTHDFHSSVCQTHTHRMRVCVYAALVCPAYVTYTLWECASRRLTGCLVFWFHRMNDVCDYLECCSSTSHVSFICESITDITELSRCGSRRSLSLSFRSLVFCIGIRLDVSASAPPDQKTAPLCARANTARPRTTTTSLVLIISTGVSCGKPLVHRDLWPEKFIV